MTRMNLQQLHWPNSEWYFFPGACRRDQEAVAENQRFRGGERVLPAWEGNGHTEGLPENSQKKKKCLNPSAVGRRSEQMKSACAPRGPACRREPRSHRLTAQPPHRAAAMLPDAFQNKSLGFGLFFADLLNEKI